MHAVATNTSAGVKRTHAAMAAPGGIKSIYEICAGFANGEVLVPKHFLQYMPPPPKQAAPAPVRAPLFTNCGHQVHAYASEDDDESGSDVDDDARGSDIDMVRADNYVIDLT